MSQTGQSGKLVIHIGPRKTATTFLQSSFFRNRAALQKHGWIYPVVSMRVQNAHHEVASARQQILAGGGPILKRLQKAARLARENDCGLLLSSEGFHPWTPDDFKVLAGHIGFSRLTIVSTLRDPVSIFASLWGEMVKNNRTPSLPDLARLHFSDPAKSRLLNPLLELRPFLKADRVDLVVLNFEAIKASGEDFHVAFCRLVLGLEDMTPARTLPANSSYPVEFTEYLRMLSPLVGYERKPHGLMYARAVEKCHSEEERRAIVAAIAACKPEAGLTITQSRDLPWLEQLDRRINKALGDRLVPHTQGQRIFPRGDVAMNCYDIDILVRKPEIASLLKQSARKMRPSGAFWLWTAARLRILLIWRWAKRSIGR